MTGNPLVSPMPITGLDGLDIEASVNFFRWPGRGFDVVLMLGPSMSDEYVKRGEFWAEWNLAQQLLVRFKLEVVVFNRAVFAAAEVLSAFDRTQVPRDALWLLQEPPSQPDGATT